MLIWELSVNLSYIYDRTIQITRKRVSDANDSADWVIASKFKAE
jgi:hypothetical protein